MFEKLLYDLFPNRIDEILEKRRRERTEAKLQWEDAWRKSFPKSKRNVPIDLYVDWLEYRRARMAGDFGNPKPLEELTEEERQYLNGTAQKTVHLQCVAEICCGDWVVEILPDLISGEEFRAKNWFFRKAGYHVIWVLNFLEDKDPDWEAVDMEGVHFKWHWKEPHEMLDGFIPQQEKNVRVYLQYTEAGAEEDIMDRIIWVATQQNPEGHLQTDYHTFATVEDEVCDAESLKELIGCECSVTDREIIWDKND